MTPHGPRPDISVIIPTHNRPASLLRLLHALREGTFPASRFEAVVVADGCTDDTATVARNVPFPFPVEVLEQNPGRGAGAARNLGATHANGELLVFLDDDVEPLPTLLAEHHRAHAEAGVAAVAIGPPFPVRTPESDLDTIGAGPGGRVSSQDEHPGTPLQFRGGLQRRSLDTGGVVSRRRRFRRHIQLSRGFRAGPAVDQEGDSGAPRAGRRGLAS